MDRPHIGRLLAIAGVLGGLDFNIKPRRIKMVYDEMEPRQPKQRLLTDAEKFGIGDPKTPAPEG